MAMKLLSSIAGAFSAACVAFSIVVLLGITFTGWPP